MNDTNDTLRARIEEAFLNAGKSYTDQQIDEVEQATLAYIATLDAEDAGEIANEEQMELPLEDGLDCE
jgi:hypothetical protein